MTKEQRGIIYVVIFEVIAGFNTFAIKQINPEFPSSVMVFTRFAIATIFFFLVIAFQKSYWTQVFHLSRKQLLSLFFLGAVGSGVASTFYVLAVRTVGITLSTIIGNLEIPLGIAFAVFFLQEKLTSGFIKVAVIILFGFFLLLIPDGVTLSYQSMFFMGVIFALCSAIIWASATLVGKKLLTAEVSPIVVPFFRNFFAAIFALLLALVTSTRIVSSYSILNQTDWFWIIFSGVAVTGVGFLLYYKGLQIIEVKKISLLFTLSPVISILLGILSGEQLHAWQWLGVVLIFYGLVILLRKPNKTVIVEEKNQAV